MFVFYFGIISDLTPPVALAAMVAAGLAGGAFWPTALNATKLAVAGFVIPFMFVYNPALLLNLDDIHIVEATFNVVTAIVGVTALAGVVQNYFYVKLKVHERILLLAAAFLLIMPTYIHSLIGAILFGVVVALQVYRAKKQSPAIS
jgi:TRAP-type uncharacterized transport system fused permease subunit